MKTPANLTVVLLQTTISIALLSACATDTDLETAFCASLAKSPATTVTAAQDANGAPSVVLEDENAEVTLIDLGGASGELGGALKYAADEAGHFAFGLDADIPFAVTDSAGIAVPIVTSVQGSTACAELAVRHTVLLEPNTYTLTFGPTDASSVRIVAEESNDDLAL